MILSITFNLEEFCEEIKVYQAIKTSLNFCIVVLKIRRETD